MIHGTNKEELSAICETGSFLLFIKFELLVLIHFFFFFLKKGLATVETDDGFYGQGIIFSFPISLT